MTALSVRHVSHNFGAVAALKDVSLCVPRGQFTALLGVNGAGKTTHFSLITRLYDNASGQIAVAGHDLRREPGKALARLGVVFQSRALDADLRWHKSCTTTARCMAFPGASPAPAWPRC